MDEQSMKFESNQDDSGLPNKAEISKAEAISAFDPTWVTEEDKRMMLGRLKFYKRNRDAGKFFEYQAVSMKILDPGLELDLSEEDSRITLNRLNKIKEEKKEERFEDIKWESLLKQAACTKILYPNVELNLGQDAWSGFIKSFDLEKRVGTGWGAVLQAKDIKIINPELDLGLDTVFWEKAYQGLKELKEDHNWDLFAQTAAAMKILDPKINLGISSAEWDQMKKDFEIARKNTHTTNTGFASMAMYMKLISAEVIEVTNNGLEVFMSRREKAESVLLSFEEVFNDVENGVHIVDLNESSNIPGYQMVAKKEVLGSRLTLIKNEVQYLDPDKQDRANSLIIKAEIYLSQYK